MTFPFAAVLVTKGCQEVPCVEDQRALDVPVVDKTLAVAAAVAFPTA